MEIRLPWITLYGNEDSWRCRAAMLAHEFIFEPWGRLIGRSEHERPNRWTKRYAIGAPSEPDTPPGTRGSEAMYNNDYGLPPVVDGKILYRYDPYTRKVMSVLRGNQYTGTWEDVSRVAGVTVLRKFDFSFDSAGLVTGFDTGFAPVVGEVLLDAWFNVETPWDAGPAYADFGTYWDDGENGQNITGWFGESIGSPPDLNATEVQDIATLPEDGLRVNVGKRPMSLVAATMVNAASALENTAGPLPASPVPTYDVNSYEMNYGMPFTASHNLKIAVNTTGRIDNGADPGATMGAATLYVLTAVPADITTSSGSGSPATTPTGYIRFSLGGSQTEDSFTTLRNYINSSVDVPVTGIASSTWTQVTFPPLWIHAGDTIQISARQYIDRGAVTVTAGNSALILVRLDGGANKWVIADMTTDINLLTESLPTYWSYDPENIGGETGTGSADFTVGADAFTVVNNCLVQPVLQVSWTWSP